MIDILRSEWTKIRSVRSTMWTLAVTAVLMLGFSALVNITVRNSASDALPGEGVIMSSLAGTMLASLSMATLGVLVISSEYRTGGIRTSLMAVPRRLRLLTGKIVVFAVVSMVVCTVAAAGAVGLGLSVSQPPSFDLGQAARAALGAGLYLTACGLFGLGLGTLVRHTPGAIVSAIALILVLPTLAGQLPGEWGRTVAEYFTTNAGMLVVSGQSNGSLGPWSGFGVYLAWVAVATIAGAFLLRRRDA
ncbi:ABC transporter permease subunit [Spongiactinospora sp. TRM90649]|uniref:ABC transporter permease subunit n=1 Tax=Spongiactinospora sp. TRM90649 TaxID=3031114 RepID=UPI0023F9910D|nr:ABC transporter permease subunit [Spongiactinospora sp. TRM90649]MDF5752915.1 ABC transporter permease subunit [Spongiactinospora sp. TRM90649]